MTDQKPDAPRGTIPPPSPARGPRDPATVYDLAAARQQAMPRENREHVADMLLAGSDLDVAELRAALAEPGVIRLADPRFTLPPERPPTSHLARILLLAFAAGVGVVIWWLLP